MFDYRRLTLFLACIAALVCSASAARANSGSYAVTVNTSSVSGSQGFIDLQFEPGILVTQSGFVTITGFSTDGTLSPPAALTGDASGDLGGTVRIDNGTVFNDYFEGITFGNALTFDVNFLGAAATSPDGTSTSGSAFSLAFFASDGATPILTTDTVNGFAELINLNLDGGTTPTVSSGQVSSSVIPSTPTVPEPGPLVLMSFALPLIVAISTRRRRFC